MILEWAAIGLACGAILGASVAGVLIAVGR
jgi:hypothetical protein